MNNLCDYFKKINENNKLSQSFLIGNVSYDEIKEELEEIISKYIFNEEIKIENNPNIYIYKTNEKSVTKEDIKTLLIKLKSTSQFSNKKIYIIEDSELLNTASNNALLKTLEEPEQGIYAILLTKNIDSILPTISSRCQKIFVSSSSKETIDVDCKDIANLLINQIEKNGEKTIFKYSEIYSIISNRDMLINVLKIVLSEYEKSLLEIINNNNKNNIISENNTIEDIAKKMIIINNNINRLNNNMNKNISIDRFIIEMWRSKNESSRS